MNLEEAFSSQIQKSSFINVYICCIRTIGSDNPFLFEMYFCLRILGKCDSPSLVIYVGWKAWEDYIMTYFKVG
jgi:hypothetical protein